MLDFFQFGFITRGFFAGILIAIIAPLIGIFLVLRRYSLIADTLSHVSLAGVAIGLLLDINPFLTAIIVSVLGSFGIEKLRNSKKVYGESALAIFLSGSLALALVILSIAKGFNVNLFSYLFGSIMTVNKSDIVTITIVGVVILVLIKLFYKELVYVTFDEESAKVSGINSKFIHFLLILLSSLTVALSIPIVGVLLISALIVIPVVSALQLKKSFGETLLYAELFSIISVIMGIFLSYYLNLATGGIIVLVAISIFLVTTFLKTM